MATLSPPPPGVAKGRLASADVRLRRSVLKRALKRGETTLADALNAQEAETMLLWDLLLFLPGRRAGGNGKQLTKSLQTAELLFAKLHRSALARVGDLTEREKRILVAAHDTIGRQ